MTAQPSIKKADAGADRAATMYELYAGGATLEQVGARHNMSRERVRQILSDTATPCGLCAKLQCGHTCWKWTVQRTSCQCTPS